MPPPRNPFTSSLFQMGARRGGGLPSSLGRFSSQMAPRGFGERILSGQNSIPVRGAQSGGGNSGGILSRLFQRGNPAMNANNIATGFERTAAQVGSGGGNSGGLLRGLLQPGGVNSMLSNTQQVLQTAQQVGPMIQQIQQYGPLIKNIPAMWQLYRGLKDVDLEDSEEETEEETEETTDDEEESEESVEEADDEEEEIIVEEAKSTGKQGSKKKTKKTTKKKKTSSNSQDKKAEPEKGPSKPKLYI
ncbi:VrrA/YqfQ family protein [Bacillus spongiae]|uniref:VrrA/YqfQ family protein n=1 Tax=Bacillus spongiae TaxID=2683610 RepID=A0ABU8H9I1_9BACI